MSGSSINLSTVLHKQRGARASKEKEEKARSTRGEEDLKGPLFTGGILHYLQYIHDTAVVVQDNSV